MDKDTPHVMLFTGLFEYNLLPDKMNDVPLGLGRNNRLGYCKLLSLIKVHVEPDKHIPYKLNCSF